MRKKVDCGLGEDCIVLGSGQSSRAESKGLGQAGCRRMPVVDSGDE